jgi:hypothetical protein
MWVLTSMEDNAMRHTEQQPQTTCPHKVTDRQTRGQPARCNAVHAGGCAQNTAQDATCSQGEAQITLQIEPQAVEDSFGFSISDIGVSQIQLGRKL